MLKSKMESLNNLATLLDRRYKELKTKGVRFTMIYDKLNSELISLAHEYYYKELGLEESHPYPTLHMFLHNNLCIVFLAMYV